MDVHLGIEGINYNGHGEGRDENMNMVETIRNLQKDVQIHKDDNERLMKSKEKQDDFNIKLIQSLDIIEKKMNKETESSKSRSHGSNDERRKTKSVDMNHHHSPRNSNKRSHRSSSPSRFRNNKRSQVDEL